MTLSFATLLANGIDPYDAYGELLVYYVEGTDFTVTSDAFILNVTPPDVNQNGIPDMLDAIAGTDDNWGPSTGQAHG